jgi:hypothetical protein
MPTQITTNADIVKKWVTFKKSAIRGSRQARLWWTKTENRTVPSTNSVNRNPPLHTTTLPRRHSNTCSSLRSSQCTTTHSLECTHHRPTPPPSRTRIFTKRHRRARTPASLHSGPISKNRINSQYICFSCIIVMFFRRGVTKQ